MTQIDQDLLAAAGASDHRAVLAALKKGGNPKGVDGEGRTALMIAALAGSAAVLNVLLPLSDPFAVDHHHFSALDLAEEIGNDDAANLIAEHMLAIETRRMDEGVFDEEPEDEDPVPRKMRSRC